MPGAVERHVIMQDIRKKFREFQCENYVINKHWNLMKVKINNGILLNLLYYFALLNWRRFYTTNIVLLIWKVHFLWFAQKINHQSSRMYSNDV